jgi:hypothetical protein
LRRGVIHSLTFRGELTVAQQEAANALAAHDLGVLAAPTAFGKTVIGAWLIAQRGVNTLVLVHRQQLADQWRERLSTFLDIPPRSIGQFGGGRNKGRGVTDIGMLQSLSPHGEVKDLVADYGHVLVDECHHAPPSASSGSDRNAGSKGRARPHRHHAMWADPASRRRPPAGRGAAIRPCRGAPDDVIHPSPRPADLGIQEIYSRLVADRTRTERIVAEVVEAVRQGHSPLVLTELSAPSFLALPVSWRGTVQQYVGRLHRLHDRKRAVSIFDYVDVHVPTLAKMHQKRLRGYAAIGYPVVALDATWQGVGETTRGPRPLGSSWTGGTGLTGWAGQAKLVPWPSLPVPPIASFLSQLPPNASASLATR